MTAAFAPSLPVGGIAQENAADYVAGLPGAQTLLALKPARQFYLAEILAVGLYALVVAAGLNYKTAPIEAPPEEPMELVMEEAAPPPPPPEQVKAPEPKEVAPPPPKAIEPAVAPVEPPKPKPKPIPKPKPVPKVEHKPQPQAARVARTREEAAPARPVPAGASASVIANQIHGCLARAGANLYPDFAKAALGHGRLSRQHQRQRLGFLQLVVLGQFRLRFRRAKGWRALRRRAGAGAPGRRQRRHHLPLLSEQTPPANSKESLVMSDPIAAPVIAHSLSPVDLFLQADSIVKTVMVLLVIASAWGWAVILDKEIRLKLLNARAKKLIASIQGAELPLGQLAPEFAKASANDPLVQVYRAAADEFLRSREILGTDSQRDALQERVHRAANLASASAIGYLQARLGSLATIGAVSPFVGLFGTVWGIMNSFQGIAASNNTSLAVVAPGIAEALFATALGLVAAIPAVIFYNRIGTDITNYSKKIASFIGVFEIELSRQLSKKGERNGLRVA